VARGAGPVGRVEAERVGGRVVVGDAGGGVHQKAREELRLGLFALAIGVEHEHGALAVGQGVLHRAGEAEPVLLLHHEPVNHDFDVVNLVTVHLHLGHDVEQFAVHAHFGEAKFGNLLKIFAVVALAALYHGRQHHQLLAVEVLQDVVDNLVVALPNHLLARGVAEGFGRAGVEQAQEIVNFRDGAHRGARVARSGFLLDADDRRQALNLVHVGPLQPAHKRAGVGRKRFHVAPLALGINGVERQTRLA